MFNEPAPLSARVRIPVNRTFLVITVLTLLFLCAPYAVAADPIPLTLRVLPYYGAEGYRPTLRIVNPTSNSYTIPAPFRPVLIGSFETRVLSLSDGFLGSGGGMSRITLPSALRARVEVTDPHNTRIQIGDLQVWIESLACSSDRADSCKVVRPVHDGPVQVQDLGERGYLWVGSFGDAYLSVEWYENARSISVERVNLGGVNVPGGHVALLAAPALANRAVIRRQLIQQDAPFYVFGYDKSPNGEIDSISYATAFGGS